MDIDIDNEIEQITTNELLMKITFLESENLELEKQLSTILDNINTYELKEDQILKEEIEKDINFEVLFEISEFPFTRNDFYIRKFTYQDLDCLNIKKIQIAYIPLEGSRRDIYIKGDFNNWNLEKMIYNSSEGLYLYDAYLLNDYKYFYSFDCDGTMLCDFSNDLVVNPNTNELNNIITCSESSMKNEYFLSEKYDDLCKMTIKYKEMENKINNNLEEVNAKDEEDAIKKIALFSKDYSKYVSSFNFEKEKLLQKTKNEYDSLYKSIYESMYQAKEDVLKVFVERIINIYDHINYLIKDIDLKKKGFIVFPLNDKNGIKTNINLENSYFNCIEFTKILQYGVIYSKDESEKIIKIHNENTSSVLKIIYNKIKFEDIYNSKSVINKNNIISDQEVVPYKILPEGTDINDYNLIIDNNLIITSIKTRDSGIPVIFEAIEIKNKKSKTNFSGLVGNSILKIYTNMYSKDIVNVLHIHLNDTSQEISVDSVSLNSNDNVSEHRIFKKDFNGKELDYKLIFINNKLNKIFYNLSENYIDELLFEEIRLTQGSYVRIQSYEHSKYNGFYSKVVSLQTGMLVRKLDAEENSQLERMRSSDIKTVVSCKERHLEELPGYISIVIQFDKEKKFLENQIKLNLPVCEIYIISLKEQIELEKVLAKEQIKEEARLQNELDELFVKFEEMRKFENKDEQKKIKSSEEVRKYIDILEANYEKFNKLTLSYDIDKLKEIREISIKLSPIMYSLLRVFSFGK